ARGLSRKIPVGAQGLADRSRATGTTAAKHQGRGQAGRRSRGLAQWGPTCVTDHHPPPQQDTVTTVGGMIKIIKGMTLTNVLIIALLVTIAIPTYILYRFVNDASLLNKFASFYEEISTDKSPCTLRVASQRGAEPFFAVSTGFAYQGSDRWTISVLLGHR